MKKNKKAFTLIELLVVIAIVGIMAAVILVSLSSTRQKAKGANYIAYVAQINKVLQSASSLGLLKNLPQLTYACIGDYSSRPGGSCVGSSGIYRNQPAVDSVLSQVMSPIPPGQLSPYPYLSTNNAGVFIDTNSAASSSITLWVFANETDATVRAEMCSKMGMAVTGAYCFLAISK